MALSYDLEVATSSSLEQVARELLDIGRPLELFDASVTPEQLFRDGAVTPLRTWTRVYERNPATWAPIVTDFGITPTVAVGFSLYKHDKIPEQQDDMIRLVSGLVDRIAGDAVFSGMDVIWLMRRRGELTLNERDDIWPEHRLAAVRQAYRRNLAAGPKSTVD
ncbi:SitI3 family protein [Amycolatopsis mongoliensis]|uniref:SitI3 family protein n=1 Tax=Amycolatopsis mongoliensis TaxID=715475 RepID=A0A9Y2NNL0_9PSEU|nr:SitI3 family protein [Amycolatopsis sp. 4-36]WIY04575.1 SitI3 family protein [Amycolatopsis sp. 4-36]